MGINFNPLKITKVIRRMRGGSQAFDVECEDGNRYVAKFNGNPQGVRTLVNELMVGAIMGKLGISTPNLRILSLSPATQQRDCLYCSMAEKRVPYVDGLHLGSAFPVNPDKTVIFDFLPTRFLPSVVNLTDFAATWVLDRWLSHADCRQSIFVRAKGVYPIGFKALMIDHGYCLGGPHWKILDLSFSISNPNLNLNRLYALVNMHTECERTLATIARLSPEMLLDVARRIPAEWLQADDRERLEHLIDQIFARHGRLSTIIEHDLHGLMAQKLTQGDDSRLIASQL